MDEELDKILVTTMNDVPGYEIVAVYGEVFGLIVRARNVFSNFGASLRTVFGGEVGHTYDGPVAAEIARALPWLIGDDPRWSLP